MIKRMMLIAMLLALAVMLCGSRGVSPRPNPSPNTTAVSGGPSGDAYLLEDGSSYYLMEDGSYYLME